MPHREWLLATLSEDAPRLAAERGVSLEIDAFCTASNMDPPDYSHWEAVVRAQLTVAPATVLHAPFSELFPCAIDPKARALAMDRLTQAARIARGFGISRLVVHSGYVPRVYFPEWFEARSAEFWREYLQGQPERFELLIENVLDGDPASLRRMLASIGDPRARACLDVGHAHVASPVPVTDWIDTLAPFLRHVHLHDNHGDFDEHLPPGQGNLDISAILARLDAAAPAASITLECPDAAGAAEWLRRIEVKGNRGFCRQQAAEMQPSACCLHCAVVP